MSWVLLPLLPVELLSAFQFLESVAIELKAPSWGQLEGAWGIAASGVVVPSSQLRAVK